MLDASWATWCGHCAEEMAALERLKNSLAGQDVEVWGVTEDKPEAAERWMLERKRTLGVVLVDRGSTFKNYGVDSLPEVVVIDPQGNVAKDWVGLRTEKDVKQAIKATLIK